MDYEVINQAVRQINGLHESVSEDHFGNMSKNKIWNLKSKRIDDVLEDSKIFEEFENYVDEYRSKLNFVVAYSEFIDDYSKFDGRNRVKQKDSIQNKLFYYQSKKSTNHGKVPLQKCLNDLLGFRLVFNDFYPDEPEFCKLITSLKKDLNLMNCFPSNKEGYKGYHIYFKNGKNQFFPWELQVWNTEDVRNNEKAHRKHDAKRKYIEWPKQYEEGILRKGDDA